LSACSQSHIRRIDGETLRFNDDGTVEVKIREFFFALEELEPEQKERLSPAIRQAITEHWLGVVNSRGYNSRRSFSSAFSSYQSELRALNRSRAPRRCPFEFREIAGERLRFHHPSGEVAIKIGNSYLRPGDILPSRLGEINRSVFVAVENYLRAWRPV
jgi:hypothetical protein